MPDFTLKGSRPRGWILLVLGLLLALAPAAVNWGWVPILAMPDGSPLFTLEEVGPDEVLLVLLFLTLTVFGVATAAYGLHQIRTGRPNRAYMRLLVRLLSAMMFLVLVFTLAGTLLG